MFSIGEKVVCDNVSQTTQSYSRAKGDLSNLEVGKEYTISSVDVHRWHTVVELEGVLGSFNSCLFESAAEKEESPAN